MSLIPCKTGLIHPLAETEVATARGKTHKEKQRIDRRRIALHGVALEAFGRGFLIKGPSGIGKTTAAIDAMMEGFFWIADDLAVIVKDTQGALVMTGHRKIRKYLHTQQTGIIGVLQLLSPAQIKRKTRLAAVIDVVRDEIDDVSFEHLQTEVLEDVLPCLRISIPRAGYFNRNLLQKAIACFQEVR